LKELNTHIWPNSCRHRQLQTQCPFKAIQTIPANLQTSFSVSQSHMNTTQLKNYPAERKNMLFGT